MAGVAEELFVMAEAAVRNAAVLREALYQGNAAAAREAAEKLGSIAADVRSTLPHQIGQQEQAFGSQPRGDGLEPGI